MRGKVAQRSHAREQIIDAGVSLQASRYGDSDSRDIIMTREREEEIQESIRAAVWADDASVLEQLGEKIYESEFDDDEMVLDV